MVDSREIDALLTSEGHCILSVYIKRSHISLGNVIVDTVLSIFPVFHETKPIKEVATAPSLVIGSCCHSFIYNHTYPCGPVCLGPSVA